MSYPSHIIRTYVRAKGNTPVSGLMSAVEEFRSEELAGRPDAVIEEDFAELQRASEAIEAEKLRRLAEIDRRRTFERDGHLSSASWLATEFSMSWGAAREEVRVARALEDMPKTREALEGGEISTGAVRVLVSAREADPEAFRRCERELVAAARIHRIRELQRAAGYWRQAVEREHRVRDVDILHANRRLHASPTIFGMVRVDGDLDPETGEALLTAVGAIMDAESRSPDPSDRRTPAQRRADALGEVCRQWLEGADRPSVGGEKPHLTVTVDVEALREGEGGGGTAELDHVGPVRPEVARRLGCDASIMRVVMAGRSEPLDVGRRTPVVPPPMRRAVIVRDRGCRFPGCDRPHPWCQAHHVVHWADGGPTAVPNLLLLCSRHHRMVHRRGGFRLELAGGRAVFRRPDGSVLEERAPP
jgi:Domain of unknown function (DUF222)/HNH endonuclease